MSRQIKFRAWDKTRNKMVYLNNSGYVMDTLYFTTKQWNDTGACQEGCKIPNNVIMQFTGLLDKNGKEIYEDDIVDCSRIQISDDKEIKFFRGVVKFHPEQGYFIEYNSDYMEFGIKGQYQEVVGNIYENKI